MPLISCSDCGKEISDRAPTCPNCGAPTTNRSADIALDPASHTRVTRTGAAWEGVGFLMLVIGMIIGMAAEPPVSQIGGVGAFAGFVIFLAGRFK